MNTSDTNKDIPQEKNVSLEKKAFIKKGAMYLLLAVACVVLFILMYTYSIPSKMGAVIIGGISIAVLVLLVGGLVYLIKGFVGRG